MPENTISGTIGDWSNEVSFDGRRLDPTPSRALRDHSPDGFAWGYSGSGPSQLALAILLAANVMPSKALAAYQDFKREFIVGLPPLGDWTLKLDVAKWAEGSK